MNEDLLSDADLWEKKRREGMSADEATAYVLARQRRRQAEGAATAPPAGEAAAEVPATDEPGGIGAFARRVLTAAPTATSPFTPLLRALGIRQEEDPDVARAAAQGLTFGFADELAGAVRGALGPGTVSEGIEAEREALEAFGARRPGVRAAAELAGGAALGGASSGLARRLVPEGASRARTLAGLIAGGAGGGAAFGAGTAEGGLRERAEAAAEGGAIGAAAAPLIAGAVRVVGGTGRRLLDILGARPQTRGNLPIPDVPETRAPAAAAAQEAGGPLARALAASPPPAEGVGGVRRRGIARPRRRDAGLASLSPVQSAEERALERITAALERDRTPIEQIAAAAQSAREAGKPATLMELAGENVRGVARAARAIPSRAKTEITEGLQRRTAGQEDRVISDLLETTGIRGRTNVVETTEDLIARRRAAAQPLYEAAYQKSVDVSGEIADALELPAFRRAYERGRAIARTEGVELPALPRTASARAGAPKTLPVQAIDYMKRGLDDLIEGRMRSGKMGRAEARALRRRLDGVLKQVDEQVPEYKQARAQYAGDSAVLDALEKGRGLWKMDPDEAAKVLREMGESEKEAFRRGATETLAQRLEDVSGRQDVTIRRPLDERTRDRRRLRLLFEDDAGFERFKDLLAQEARMAETQRVVTGGSQTADKLAEIMDIAGLPVETLLQAATGSPGGLIRALASEGLRGRMRGFSAGIADELAPRLTAGLEDPRDLDRVLAELAAFSERLAAQRQAARGRALGGASVVAGSVAGR